MTLARWVGAVLIGSAGYAAAVNSPVDVVFSPDGRQVAVSDSTASRLVWLDVAGRKVTGSVALRGRPAGTVWVGGKVYVAEYDAGTVAEVDPTQGKAVRRLAVGPKPTGVGVAAKKNVLLATDYGLGCVVVVDLVSGKERKRILTLPQAWSVAVGPDESLAAVGHLTPAGDAMRSVQASAVTIVDLNTCEKVAEIALPAGSTNVRGIAFSADGKWIYVVHTLGRFTLPTTQLERGWINTNVMTILDVEKRCLYVTVLLDVLSAGAADPWGVAVSPDGKTAWVTLAGAQELAEVRLETLHTLLAGRSGATNAIAAATGVWAAIAKDPAQRAELVNDLAALYAAGLSARHQLPGNGPRGVAVSPDGRQVAVAAYFSGEVLLTDTASPKRAVSVPMGQPAAESAERRGERAFHDATFCFQKWLSCATCHPGGRADGLNWDLLNDGMGNPKNAKSMVWSHKTPPAMSLGVRSNMDVAAEKGFHFIQFQTVAEQTLQDVRSYLRSLEPEASPYLVNGRLSPKAEKGKKVFENAKVGCAQCHPGPLYTDLKMYDVGTAGELDRDQKEFDTPTCIELWRTPPYLHDGSAATLLDMLTVRNKDNKHGNTSTLSKDDLEALVEYLLSL